MAMFAVKPKVQWSFLLGCPGCKKEQKSPAEIESLMKFAYSLKASLALLSVLPFKLVNTTFQKSLLGHTKHFPPREQSA